MGVHGYTPHYKVDFDKKQAALNRTRRLQQQTMEMIKEGKKNVQAKAAEPQKSNMMSYSKDKEKFVKYANSKPMAMVGKASAAKVKKINEIAKNVDPKKIVALAGRRLGPVKAITPPGNSAAAIAQNTSNALKAMHRENFDRAQARIKSEVQRPGV